ncbi:monocarboxylate transporter 6 isoform X2 [Ornithorhynchus anatinus]|uniref:monocarboxylate transporter 6 isoform X2 n=1 Tax=Ornithorhynchus anatinus TaxID=9258 RepID=UPI0019D4A026|nr:monocarboxylate transporter 6 isoform X2 [Ornithorhynchus anatinus]
MEGLVLLRRIGLLSDLECRSGGGLTGKAELEATAAREDVPARPVCISVFFTELQHEFQASNSETSWFPSILTAVLHAGGPVCGVLVEQFGCRVAVMAGGLLAGLGLVASSFSRSLSQLYLTAGFITGLGASFTFQASITILGYYFSRRRALANALASAGVSIGLTLWPLLSRHLLDSLGWRGSFLVFGGVLLNCCVCGAVMRPLKASPPEHAAGPPPPAALRGCLWACGRALQRYLAFDVFRHNRGYRIYTLGVVWMVMGFVLPHIYLVPYAMRHGVDPARAALLISIIGFSNIFMRPAAGLLAGSPACAGRRIHLFSLALLLNGLTNLLCVTSADFRVLVGYCLVYSVSMSGVGALIFQVLMDIVPMDRFPSALGLFTVLESCTILIGPPLAGLLLDATGDFRYVFCTSSFILVSAALYMGISFCLMQRKEQPADTGTLKEPPLEETLLPGAAGDLPPKKPPSPLPLRVEVMYVTSV